MLTVLLDVPWRPGDGAVERPLTRSIPGANESYRKGENENSGVVDSKGNRAGT